MMMVDRYRWLDEENENLSWGNWPEAESDMSTVVLWWQTSQQVVLLLAESERMLQVIVDEFDKVYERRKLSVSKCEMKKIMVLSTWGQFFQYPLLE